MFYPILSNIYLEIKCIKANTTQVSTIAFILPTESNKIQKNTRVHLNSLILNPRGQRLNPANKYSKMNQTNIYLQILFQRLKNI